MESVPYVHVQNDEVRNIQSQLLSSLVSHPKPVFPYVLHISAKKQWQDKSV